MPLTFEYELCYRCHGDNQGNEPPVVSRYIFETNTRLEFSTSNASYHPVEAMGKNRDVPSLIPPLTVTSRIGCTDCHNSDSGDSINGPRGPHGSVWRPILEPRRIHRPMHSVINVITATLFCPTRVFRSTDCTLLMRGPRALFVMIPTELPRLPI